MQIYVNVYWKYKLLWFRTPPAKYYCSWYHFTHSCNYLSCHKEKHYNYLPFNIRLTLERCNMPLQWWFNVNIITCWHCLLIITNNYDFLAFSTNSTKYSWHCPLLYYLSIRAAMSKFMMATMDMFEQKHHNAEYVNIITTTCVIRFSISAIEEMWMTKQI